MLFSSHYLGVAMATRITIEIPWAQESTAAANLCAILNRETGIPWTASESADSDGKLGVSSLIITAVVAGSAEETTRMALAKASKVLQAWRARHRDPPTTLLTSQDAAEDQPGDLPADET
jgi:hypothetical protein